MRLKAELEIELPDDADFWAIEDAKLDAERSIKWYRVFPKQERMKMTDLTDKCGSCKYFTSKPDLFSNCYGSCSLGYKGYRQRAHPKCKKYERSDT